MAIVINILLFALVITKSIILNPPILNSIEQNQLLMDNLYYSRQSDFLNSDEDMKESQPSSDTNPLTYVVSSIPSLNFAVTPLYKFQTSVQDCIKKGYLEANLWYIPLVTDILSQQKTVSSGKTENLSLNRLMTNAELSGLLSKQLANFLRPELLTLLDSSRQFKHPNFLTFLMLSYVEAYSSNRPKKGKGVLSSKQPSLPHQNKPPAGQKTEEIGSEDFEKLKAYYLFALVSEAYSERQKNSPEAKERKTGELDIEEKIMEEAGSLKKALFDYDDAEGSLQRIRAPNSLSPELKSPSFMEGLVKLHQYLADSGSPHSALVLGHLNEEGTFGVAADRNRALSYYQQAVEAGEGQAGFHLSRLLLASEDPEEQRRGLTVLEEASQNDALAMAELGRMYLLGINGVEKDEQNAKEILLKGVAKGEENAASFLGHMYLMEENLEKAEHYLLIAEDKGLPTAILGGSQTALLAGKYRSSISKASKLLRYTKQVLLVKGLLSSSLKKGEVSPSLCYSLLLHSWGCSEGLEVFLGLSKLVLTNRSLGYLDFQAVDKALLGDALFGLSRAESTPSKHCVMLGNLLWLLDRKAKSIDLFHKAAEANHTEGLLILADLYARGDGVSRDIDKAVELFGRVKKSDSNAFFTLYHYCCLIVRWVKGIVNKK